MSDAPDKPSKEKDRDKGSGIRRQRSIYQVHYNIKKREEMTARPLVMPTSSLEVQKYEQQVAGHKGSEDRKFLGLLQCNNGTILKPIIKEAHRREIAFYTRVSTATTPDLVELRRCIPQYFGCTTFTFGGFTQEYIVLEDLGYRMLEPCIMDVKIGKRTWDPLASPEKRAREERKYARCKQQYGFCIPGYQVRAGNRLARYGKDCGKRLHGAAVIDAIRNYLNGVGTGLCRALLLQFLSELWKIQKWSRHQRSVKLYSASLLLLYDAAKVRECCAASDNGPRPRACSGRGGPPRRRSLPSLHGAGGSFSGQLSPAGPLYRKLAAVPLTSLALAQTSFTPPPPVTSPWTDALERLNHNHSFEHNYEEKLSKIKMNYRATLDQLCSDSPNPNPWGTVKIIDFAHAFFNEDDDRTLDDNFRVGIDNFVEIFECFLRETDDQII